MSIRMNNILCAIKDAILGQPGGTCEDPIYTTSCDPPPDVVDIDVEFVCNADTGFWDSVSTTTTNGVPAAPVVTPTDIPCPDPDTPPDMESVRVCDDVTDTYHIVTTAYAADGTSTQISDVDTGESCKKGVPECVKWQSTYIQLDNTGTSFNDSHEITLENCDGSTTVINVAPQANFSAQITEWAAQLDAAYAGVLDPRCTTGCGGLLPPPSDAPAQPGISLRYVNGVFCPTDKKIPISATVTASSNPKAVGRVLPFASLVGPEYRGQICRTCEDGAGELQYEDGTPVEPENLPACTFSCDETIPEPPAPACTFSDFLPVCEIKPGDYSDPDNPVDPEIVTADVFLQFTTCGSDVTVSAYVTEDDALVPHELGEDNYYGDCDTLEPAAGPPVPACPEGAVFSPVEVGGSYFILDNSNWTGAPTPHLQNGNNYEFTFTHADGTTTVVQQTADPYFPNFKTMAEAAMPGCKVINVCANHTSPSGCKPSFVANLAAYPAYDVPTAPGDPQNNIANPDQNELWATGWMLDCGDCNEEVVRVEITNATDAAYIGAFKEPNVYQKPKQVIYQAVTCDGVFYKDCDGNDLPAPPCCPKPYSGDAAAFPDCLFVDCPDPCTNGSTYINGRPPAGDPWSWGPYSADNLNDFEAALTAAGYTVHQFGEKHQICPPFGAFGEPASQVTNSFGTFDATVEPNIDPDFVPEDTCAIQVDGKNDDRRDTFLEEIASTIGECVEGGGDAQSEPVTHTAQNNDTDFTWSYNQTVLKLQGQLPLNSPDAQPFYDAIVSCIEGGGTAKITFTNVDGLVGTFNADSIISDNGQATGAFGGGSSTG